MSLPTGIGTLDRKLGGGLPPGTLVAVIFPPEVQHDPLLCAGANERASYFFTTVKSEAAARKSFDRAPVPADIETIEKLELENATAQLTDGLDELDEDEDFYLDVIDPVEETLGAGEYVDLLNMLTEQLNTGETIGYLYGYETTDPPHNRRYTLDIADCVIKLRARQEHGKLNYYLEIPKANGLKLTEKDRYLEIEIGRGVDIDETRNI